MKASRVWPTIVGTLIVVVAVAAFWPRGIQVQVATVSSGAIRQYVDEQAVTRLPRVYRITMPQAGRIAAISLRPGDPVKSGQVVAKIISEDLANTVAEARAVVERLEAAIVENNDVTVEQNVAMQARQFVESMNNTVDAARARTEASGKRAEFAETNLGRVRQLRTSNATTELDLDRANLEYWEGQLGYRQDQLVWEAMKSIRSATELLPKMVDDYIARKQLRRAVLEKQKAEAQARLQRILTEQKRGTMVSPIDGVVLSRQVEDEQHLPAGSQLLVLGARDQLEVEADLLSEDAVAIAPEDSAVIYGPALRGGPEQGVPATVHRVYPEGFTKLSSLGVEQQRVKVILHWTADHKGTDVAAATPRWRSLGVGYRVRARIFTAAREHATLVPRSAIFRSPQGGWQTFVVEGSRARLRNIEVGLINDRHAEARQGVSQGDRVILAPDTELADGVRVAPVTP